MLIAVRTTSLGKYGSFPTNLIIDRPFHLTYEVQDKREGESFSRLRIVPASELHAEALADTSADLIPEEAGEDVVTAEDGEELTLVDESSGQVLVRSKRAVIDESARQTLTSQEIEELKKKGAAAGKELITKLLLSHTAIDQKTGYSLAKYKLLKTKKYIRRFAVLPLDVPLLAHWLLEDKDAAKIMEMRSETMALIGCWANVHFAAPTSREADDVPPSGRWLVVDDTAGLLTASLAERMGILHPEAQEEEGEKPQDEPAPKAQADVGAENAETTEQPAASTETNGGSQKFVPQRRKRPRPDDLEIPFAPTNSITLLHHNTQANLFLLRYFGYDNTDPDPQLPYHSLFTNVMTLSWIQLLHPDEDPSYADKPVDVSAETLASWKTNRRANHHRKRRRWARTNHIVNTARAGNFGGLAVASTMDPTSVLRHTLPLLAGGAPIAIYSQNVEPLSELADCFSITRRAAWVSSPPAEAVGKTPAELERWEGSEDFPLNPMLLLGTSVHTSRARTWQVLPNRTHPLMTERGGAEGYVFTAWRAVPAEGKVEGRGKYQRRREAPV